MVIICKRSFLMVMTIGFLFQLHGQNPKDLFFSSVIEKNIKAFNRKSEQAFLNNDMERVSFLFDSLVNHVVKGSQLDNFTFHRLNKRKVELDQFRKPLFILTYSSWYPINPGEIRAINDLGRKFSKEIDFLVIFWDPPGQAKKASAGIKRPIQVLYADEKQNVHDHVISSMKHSFGVPTLFITDENRRVLTIGRIPAFYYNEGPEVIYQTKTEYFYRYINKIQENASPLD